MHLRHVKIREHRTLGTEHCLTTPSSNTVLRLRARRLVAMLYALALFIVKPIKNSSFETVTKRYSTKVSNNNK